jgi:hypothetical protein
MKLLYLAAVLVAASPVWLAVDLGDWQLLLAAFQ